MKYTCKHGYNAKIIPIIIRRGMKVFNLKINRYKRLLLDKLIKSLPIILFVSGPYIVEVFRNGSNIRDLIR